MGGSAQFYFHNSLNDFLPYAKRATWVSYSFTNTPAVKDAIEAIGVPHPEIDVILVNNVPVQFYYPLQTGDRIAVYPVHEEWQWPATYSVKNGLPEPNGFILDVHLGKLAKALRLLGFNALYRNDYTDNEIAQIAQKENRAVLTRDIGLLKHRSINRGYWLRSQQVEEQITEVIHYFKLADKFHPFHRCLACNSEIVPVSKKEVMEQLPPRTVEYFHEFYQCPSCKRVYWKGSHYDRLLETISRIKKSIEKKEK